MLDYRKMADLYLRGATKNAIAVIIGCKWETVDLAIRRMLEKWGSLESIPDDLNSRGIKKAIHKKRKAVDEDYLQPDFSKLSRVDRQKQKSELWEEYCQEAVSQGKKPYQISYFNELLAKYDDSQDISYTQEHQPGFSSQVDWAGDKGYYMDPYTGALVAVDVFVMDLPYSSYYFAEGFLDQKMNSFLLGHQHAFEFFGGVTPIVIPDNCATAVDRKTGVLNTKYVAFLDHYGAIPRPTRVRAPKDKGGVERHVGIIEKDILPKINAMPITSLAEFNRILLSKVMAWNDKEYSKRDGSRTSVFLSEEKTRLKPLPACEYHSYTEKEATVHRDFHIQYDSAYYSVPVTFVGKKVTVRDDSCLVKIFSSDGIEIASHLKATRKWQRRTDESHIPAGHTPGNVYTLDMFISWAEKFGPSMKKLCEAISGSFQYPVQSFRTLQTILSKAEKCDLPSAAEEAAGKCLSAGIRSSKGFSTMLSACLPHSEAHEEKVNLDDIYCSREEK